MASEDILVLVTLTVPKELEKMSINLQAPIVINARTRKAAQVIVDTEQYPVKFFIYDILQKMKKEGE
jgi:flagellar assembly factor FliW